MDTALIPYHDPLTLLDQTDLAESTKDQYRKALTAYLATGESLLEPHALAAHAQTLPASGRAFLKAGLRILTDGAANSLKGRATPDNVAAIQAALYRIEALQN
ncbi:MAG: hypothetical protein DRI81_19605, partial [Chloroflexi bacterium]